MIWIFVLYSLYTWKTFDESLSASLRGVPTLSGFGARLRTFLSGQAFSVYRPYIPVTMDCVYVGVYNHVCVWGGDSSVVRAPDS